MKMDSGSHPNLYKFGMKLYQINPALWEYGMKTLSLPSKVSSDMKFKFGDKKVGGNINNVNIELSVVCNLRCSFCWWWGEKGIAFDLVKNKDSMVSRELTTQEIMNLVDQLGRYKPSFYLSGGEPFIRKDTVDIIEYIAAKGMSVITNNNGTMLTEDKLQRLAKIKNLTINFSIDGPREVHDSIRGQGMYDKTTNTIRRLLEIRGNSMYPAIKTNTTFSPWIQGRLDELVRTLQDDVGVDAVRMQHLWFTDQEHADQHKRMLKSIFGTDEGRGVDSHVISRPKPEYYNALADEIMKIQATKYKKPVFIHPKMAREEIQRYYSDLTFTKMDRCFVAWNYIIVKANGDVMFCPDEWMTDFKLGNVRTSTVESMWNGEKAGKFREELYRHKLFPACARCCAING